MGLIVQDDTGLVADANGYITAAFFKTYHTDRGRDVSAYGDSDIEAKIVLASGYLDRRFTYKGQRRNARVQQATEWPRIFLKDLEGRTVNGVPREVKQATAEYALRAFSKDLNPDPTRDDSGRVILSKSEEVGPIAESVTYAAAGAFELPKYPEADLILKRAGYVVSSNTMRRG